MELLLVEDALSANAPPLRQLTGLGWKDVLNVKPASHPRLFNQFAGRRARSAIKEWRQPGAEGVQQDDAWTTHWWLCDSAPDVAVDVLLYEPTTPDGEVNRWRWIPNLPLHGRSVAR